MLKNLKYRNDIISFLKFAKKENLIGEIKQEIYYHNDEPKIPSFIIEAKDESFTHFGYKLRRYSSFSKEHCLLKILGEIIERYFLGIYNEKDLIWNSYKKLKKKAVDPKDFVSFYKLRKKPSFKIYDNENEKLNWVKATCLNNGKNIFVPAQLIYLLYRFKKNEPVINLPVSTGAAFFTNFEDALLRAILEVIERDAFMVNYLNKFSRNIIDIKKSKDDFFKKIFLELEKYNLELYILDISTDIPVYSVLAILIDRTGVGPAVSVGTKADLNIKEAIIGAIEECFQVRPWIKSMMIIKGGKAIKNSKKSILYGKEEKLKRGLLWSTKDMINNIDFFLKGKKVSISKFPLQKIKSLNNLLEWFNKEKIELFYKNVTPLGFKNKFFTIKVLIPHCQPLYFDERFPSWNIKRLKEVSQRLGLDCARDINEIPHPFL